MKIRILFLLIAFSLPATVSVAQWVPTSGPTATWVEALVANGTDLYAGTAGSGFQRSSNNGANWTTTKSPGIEGNTTIDAFLFMGLNLFAAGDGGVWLSKDSGTTWTGKGFNNGSGTITSLAKIAGNEEGFRGEYLFAGTSSGIYRSSDSGTSWTSENNGLSDVFVLSLAVNGTNLFASTEIGIFRSNDNGANWTNVNNNLTNDTVISLAVRDTEIFAGTHGGGLFRSTNNGDSWLAANIGIENTNIYGIAFLDSIIFVSHADGFNGGRVFRSDDNGQSWIDLSTGLADNKGVFQLAILGSNIFAGAFVEFTNSNISAVWYRPLSEMIGSSRVQSNVSSTALEESYPNPFSRRTTIPFSLAQTEHVTLKIFDILGQEIATLVDQDFDAGPHEVVWDAQSATLGIYFLRIATADGVQTQSLILENK